MRLVHAVTLSLLIVAICTCGLLLMRSTGCGETDPTDVPVVIRTRHTREALKLKIRRHQEGPPIPQHTDYRISTLKEALAVVEQGRATTEPAMICAMFDEFDPHLTLWFFDVPLETRGVYIQNDTGYKARFPHILHRSDVDNRKSMHKHSAFHSVYIGFCPVYPPLREGVSEAPFTRSWWVPRTILFPAAEFKGKLEVGLILEDGTETAPVEARIMRYPAADDSEEQDSEGAIER